MNAIYFIPIFAVVLVGMLSPPCPRIGSKRRFDPGRGSSSQRNTSSRRRRSRRQSAPGPNGIHNFHFLGSRVRLADRVDAADRSHRPRETPWEQRFDRRSRSDTVAVRQAGRFHARAVCGWNLSLLCRYIRPSGNAGRRGRAVQTATESASSRGRCGRVRKSSTKRPADVRRSTTRLSHCGDFASGAVADTGRIGRSSCPRGEAASGTVFRIAGARSSQPRKTLPQSGRRSLRTRSSRWNSIPRCG